MLVGASLSSKISLSSEEVYVCGRSVCFGCGINNFFPVAGYSAFYLLLDSLYGDHKQIGLMCNAEIT